MTERLVWDGRELDVPVTTEEWMGLGYSRALAERYAADTPALRRRIAENQRRLDACRAAGTHEDRDGLPCPHCGFNTIGSGS
jgi:hypothetical protein